MLRVQGNPRSGAKAAWRLPCLFFALAAAAAVAEQAKATPGVDDQYAPAHASRTTYRVVNLASGPLSTIPKINAKGQVVFSINPGPASRGYFYDGAAVRDIGTLGGSDTRAYDLNNAGQVAGGSTLPDGREHAFVWTAGGGMIDLGVVPGAYNSRAQAINNQGVVAGVSEATFFVRAFRWSAADGIEDLGAFTSGLASFSNATALNDAGLIVGNSDTADIETQIFAWTRASGLVNIDTLDSRYSDAVAVNARGEVVGGHIPAGDTLLYRAYIWRPTDGMLDLGTAGGTESFSMAINERGQVPVLVNYAYETQRSMSWTRSGGMRDIGTLGGRFTRAFELNNKGQIVGSSNNRAGERRAFVWSAGTGMVDLNTRLRHAPPGLVLDDALAINDSGAIVATTNAGLVLLKPGHGGKDGHAVGPIKAPALVKVGTPLQASVAWVDEDRVGTRSINWSWGDGSSGASKMRELDGVGSASASHSYAAPGIYPLTVTLVDRVGRSTAVRLDVVVAAPGGVAGSGAVMSPPGAYAKAPLQAGKARFSLVAPAAGGTRAQGGRGRLQFDLPGLNLRSDSLRLVGRQGARQVFEGSGSIAGSGNWQFRLAATAGGPAGARGSAQGSGHGRFAIRIWRTDPVTKAEVVAYDNQRAGQEAAALVEGGIVSEAAD